MPLKRDSSCGGTALVDSLSGDLSRNSATAEIMLHYERLQQPLLGRVPEQPYWDARQLEALPLHGEPRIIPGLHAYHEPHSRPHSIQGTLSYRDNINLSAAGSCNLQDTPPLREVRRPDIFSAGSRNGRAAEQRLALPAWQYSQNANCMQFNCAVPDSSARPALPSYITAEYLLADDDHLHFQAPSTDAAHPTNMYRERVLQLVQHPDLPSCQASQTAREPHASCCRSTGIA